MCARQAMQSTWSAVDPDILSRAASIAQGGELPQGTIGEGVLPGRYSDFLAAVGPSDSLQRHPACTRPPGSSQHTLLRSAPMPLSSRGERAVSLGGATVPAGRHAGSSARDAKSTKGGRLTDDELMLYGDEMGDLLYEEELPSTTAEVVDRAHELAGHTELAAPVVSGRPPYPPPGGECAQGGDGAGDAGDAGAGREGRAGMEASAAGARGREASLSRRAREEERAAFSGGSEVRPRHERRREARCEAGGRGVPAGGGASRGTESARAGREERAHTAELAMCEGAGDGRGSAAGGREAGGFEAGGREETSQRETMQETMQEYVEGEQYASEARRQRTAPASRCTRESAVAAPASRCGCWPPRQHPPRSRTVGSLPQVGSSSRQPAHRQPTHQQPTRPHISTLPDWRRAHSRLIGWLAGCLAARPQRPQRLPCPSYTRHSYALQASVSLRLPGNRVLQLQLGGSFARAFSYVNDAANTLLTAGGDLVRGVGRVGETTDGLLRGGQCKCSCGGKCSGGKCSGGRCSGGRCSGGKCSGMGE